MFVAQGASDMTYPANILDYERWLRSAYFSVYIRVLKFLAWGFSLDGIIPKKDLTF
jgi:hypothetical protein